MEIHRGVLDFPPMKGDTALYTPLLRYSGHAEYPDGFYMGPYQEFQPTTPLMPVNGNIWLSALEDTSDEESYVRTWGDTDWKARAYGVPLAAPIDPSPLPLLAASAGLFLGTQLLPGLGRALRTGAFLLYARLREQSPDANPTRERILQLVTAEPGLNLSRIVEQLNIGWGTAAYHVQILKRQSRLKELRFLNRVCFFPAQEAEGPKQLQTVLLRQPNYREVMDVLQASPGLSQREVALKTGHARQYISRLVAKMEQASLLRAEPSPAGRKYFPLPPVLAVNGNGHANGNGVAAASGVNGATGSTHVPGAS
jgi:hypothetical protein